MMTNYERNGIVCSDYSNEITTPHSEVDNSDRTTSCRAKKIIFAAQNTISKRALAQRQKQIDYGKNTTGYKRYRDMIAKEHRQKHSHPITPNKALNISKRNFDQLIRSWRQCLHKFDPPNLLASNEVQAQPNSRAPQYAAVTGECINSEGILIYENHQLRCAFPPSVDDELL